ncbi:MAG: hypothetical protein IKG56_02015 [Clostridia bacterium]|nr:hypothetical protein [Clostridia bacterium]
MENDFRKSLIVEPTPVFSEIDEQEFIERNTRNYITLYNIPEVREYYTQVVTSIILAYSEKYGNHGIQLNYRYKSPKSIRNKMREYVRDKQSEPDIKQPMYDGFAMKLITSEVPSLMYSRDPYRLFDKDKTLSQLVSERKSNYDFLEKMQEFKSKLVEDESGNSPKSRFDVSQEEYFTNCISLLKRTLTIVDPEETLIIAQINSSISKMESKLKSARDSGMASYPITHREFEVDSSQSESPENFLAFLDNFESKMHNELAMAVLNKQFTSLFKSNEEQFRALGISLSGSKPFKRKRKDNGYESNFIYIDTLFGTIECQLQTYEQYQQGKTGSASHFQYSEQRDDDDILLEENDGDSQKEELPQLVSLPTPGGFSDPEVAMNFLQRVREISPQISSVTMGSYRTKNIDYGAFRNYYSIFAEIPPSHFLTPQFTQYFTALRDTPDSPLKNYPDQLRQYNIQDVEDYIGSDEFERLKRISELWHLHFDTFADSYAHSGLYVSNNNNIQNVPEQLTLPNLDLDR